MAKDAPTRAGSRAIAALMVFPYFFACATHLYTDMLAALWLLRAMDDGPAGATAGLSEGRLVRVCEYAYT